MSVEIKPGSTFEAGIPKPLFDVAAARTTPGQTYAASLDGQRFLFVGRLSETGPAPLAAVFNWDYALEEGFIHDSPDQPPRQPMRLPPLLARRGVFAGSPPWLRRGGGASPTGWFVLQKFLFPYSDLFTIPQTNHLEFM